jgi:hypothetical protein
MIKAHCAGSCDRACAWTLLNHGGVRCKGSMVIDQKGKMSPSRPFTVPGRPTAVMLSPRAGADSRAKPSGERPWSARLQRRPVGAHRRVPGCSIRPIQAPRPSVPTRQADLRDFNRLAWRQVLPHRAPVALRRGCEGTQCPQMPAPQPQAMAHADPAVPADRSHSLRRPAPEGPAAGWRLLEGHFREASQLAAVQAPRSLLPQ